MPQPLSKVKPDAAVFVSPMIWNTDPRLTRLVCAIIALSAEVDLELSLLLVRILGAEAAPALAMYRALYADNVKLAAVNAAAKAMLTEDQFRVFEAVIKVAQAAQKVRHKFAHWIWVRSPDITDALLLADPEHLRDKEIGRSQFLLNSSLAKILQGDVNSEEIANWFAPPSSEHILVYTEKDLLLETASLVQARSSFLYFQHYLRPRKTNHLLMASRDQLSTESVAMWKDLETSDGALQQLMTIRQFREVYRPANGHKDQNNSNPPPPELLAPPLPDQQTDP